MFSWGWRKLELINASAPLLHLGVQNTRHSIAAPRLYSHLSWGFWEWCSWIWTSWSDSCWAAGRAFEPSGCLGVVMMGATRAFEWVRFLWRRVQIYKPSTRSAGAAANRAVCIYRVCQRKTRPGSVVSAYSLHYPLYKEEIKLAVTYFYPVYTEVQYCIF